MKTSVSKYWENREDSLRKSREYYIENSERLKEKSRNYYRENKDKVLEYRKKYHEKNKNKVHNSVLKRLFGIDKEIFEKMRDSQRNLCAICKKPETAKTNLGETRRLSVDHCHNTGIVRGLLCSRCNNAIGLFLEDRETIWSAIEYLDRSRSLEKM